MATSEQKTDKRVAINRILPFFIYDVLPSGGMSNLAGIKWNNSSLSSIDKLLTSLSYVGEETEDGGGRFSIKISHGDRRILENILRYLTRINHFVCYAKGIVGETSSTG